MKKFMSIEDNEDGTCLMRMCIDGLTIVEFLTPTTLHELIGEVDSFVPDALSQGMADRMIYIPSGPEMLNEGKN
jgi:hypothetical protein